MAFFATYRNGQRRNMGLAVNSRRVGVASFEWQNRIELRNPQARLLRTKLAISLAHRPFGPLSL